jgi:protein-tyrosine-phosphatase
MKILFVCKHNRFRSKVAEAIFNKLNKNKKVTAESAGMIVFDNENFVEDSVKKIMKEKGYDIGGESRQVTRKLVSKFDVLIVVANNLGKEFFSDFKGKLIQWEIDDAHKDDLKKIARIVGEIEHKVQELISSTKDF